MLRIEIRESGTTNPLQETHFIEHCLALRQKIERFCEAQAIHMPGLAQYLGESTLDINSASWQACEGIFLHLPSSLSPAIKDNTCS